MGDNIPEEITGASNIGPTKAIPGSEEQETQPGNSFASYMQDEGKAGAMNPGGKDAVSPLNLEAQSALPTAGPTPNSILSQMNSTSSVLGDLQQKLHTKNLPLKNSQKYLLRNKLTNANEQIRTAAKKAGVDVGPAPKTISRQNPVNKFLGLITDSQTQMQNAQGMIEHLNASGKMLNPGDLLLIQIKLAKAQQELEYSSVLLSKAVDDIKQVFNTQI